jgi:hypothetical protein
MPINNGRIEGTINGTFVVYIYYDPAWLAADSTRDPGGAPLVNGPRGFCLDVTNTSGRNMRVTVSGLTGNPLSVLVGQGNPVTTGQGASRTAAQMAALGFTTRGSVGNFQVG